MSTTNQKPTEPESIVSGDVAGFNFAEKWASPTSEVSRAPTEDTNNPLKDYFDSHSSGPGIWKWNHYFDIYRRFFKKFVGTEVSILEIGIYSGGSLDMWRNYFGAGCQVYGIDVQEACKVYEGEGKRIFIGDQADREFWRRFREQVPSLDIVIDDGGHRPEQQIVTLEETLPYLRAGGVYMCEDIHRIHNNFSAYIGGLINHFNSTKVRVPAPELTAVPTAFQRDIRAIHSYPFAIVIEKAAFPVEEFVAPKHGTQWQPFLDPKPASASA